MPKLIEDNVYPNDGRFFSPFAEVDEKDSETKQAEVAHDILVEILDHLDERIEFYGSVDSVSDTTMINPDEFMHTIAANKLTRNNLMGVRSRVATLVESVKRD